MKLANDARLVARLLKTLQRRVVFAESCTAGLVSAQLAAVPGISEYHCGSLVTYRNRSKQDWLSVPGKSLDDPGPVSAVVASAMASGALKRTREADVAVSVTGHLGPHAPQKLDGLIFIAVAIKTTGTRQPRIAVKRFRLQTPTRYSRSREAAHLVFSELAAALESLA